MARKRARLLCEDKLHQVFMRRLLKRLGFDRVFLVDLPGGNWGAAEQYVREKFPREVHWWRSRRNQGNLGLVAVIDADNYSVQERKGQLIGQLEAKDMSVRTNNERIAILVPKRTIETWIASLRGQDVNEETDYKHRINLDRERECADAVEALKNILDLPVRQRQETLRRDHPPSLSDACSEIEDRLPA